MKILIGTKNPGKIQGAKEAFENKDFLFQINIQKKLRKKNQVVLWIGFLKEMVWEKEKVELTY